MSRPSRRRSVLVGAGILIAILLSAAALVVAIVRQPDTTSTSAASSATSAPTEDTSAADKALCEKVGPLLREMVEDGHRFVELGDPGTPARDAGISGYRATVNDWVHRIQPILDAESNPPRFLTRTLQSTVDFKQLYALNLRPGPERSGDAQAWNSGAIAYGGPYERCGDLGVTW